MAENSSFAETLLGSVAATAQLRDLAGTLKTLIPQQNQNSAGSFSTLIQQLTGLSAFSQAQADVLSTNTQALAQNTAALGAGNIAASLGQIASSAIGGGLGLAPLISGLAHLFSGKPDEPSPLVRFSLPPGLHFTAMNAPASGPTFPAADYDQSGMPRSVSGLPNDFSTPPASSTPRIQVNVQAMDSRSFMDHSHEIAKAVRDAMLSMHFLNDVVTDL